MDATERRVTDEILDAAQIEPERRGPEADQAAQGTFMYAARMLTERIRECAGYAMDEWPLRLLRH